MYDICENNDHYRPSLWDRVGRPSGSLHTKCEDELFNSKPLVKFKTVIPNSDLLLKIFNGISTVHSILSGIDETLVMLIYVSSSYICLCVLFLLLNISVELEII